MKKKVIFILLLLSFTVVFSQDDISESFQKPKNKGKFFVQWGWNWAGYSNSDIRFKGNNYDFTLSNVTAQDRPTDFSFHDYFHPERVTIPQTNYRIGYFLKENYTISVGVDHMKYVMNGGQSVKINGNIAVGNAKYDGVYSNSSINLAKDFLQFEHTDGLNYVNVEVKRFDDISHWFGIYSENFQINASEGLGVGFLLPKTNTVLLENDRHAEFHLSGWGFSGVTSLNITFLKHFFIQLDYKIGYIDMPAIRTTKNTSDFAAQNFVFFENTLIIGGKFNL